MTDKVPTKFTLTVRKYGWIFVCRYIHITYVQSYYMMVNKDIVCLQKIQEEKKWNPPNLWIFFFQFTQTFLNLFQLFNRKINYFKLADTDYSQIHPNWTVERLKYFGVFFAKKAPIFFVLCKKIKPQRNMTSIEVTYQASVDCRLWF